MNGSPNRRIAAGGLAVTLAIAACAAPRAERATGAIAVDVERSLASGSAAFDHAAWDALLRAGTRDGFVDYAHMAAEREALDGYLGRIATVDLGLLDAAELEAVLINAYNALTVVAILDHPEVTSIRQIDGVWTDLTWDVGGHLVTLDQIEHNLLRPFFQDPRIHFVVNCASYSCAPLPQWAFTGPELDAQLEERTGDFLTNPENVALGGGSLRVSRYFDWYGEDFVKEGWAPRAETIAAFIARYAAPDVRDAIAANPDIGLEFFDYDWSLNAITPPPAAASTRAGGAEVVLAASPSVEIPSAQEPAEATGGFFSRFQTWLAARLTGFRDWVAGFGSWAPVMYGVGYAVLVVLLVPGGTLTLGAGFTFGLWLGGLVVFLAANVGAALAFLIARYFLRERVERWLAGRKKLSAVDRAVEKQGWKVVFLTRLSPVFPFNVQNYFYGLTGVSFRGYVGASLIGMVPGTFLYVYLGVASAGVAEAAGGTVGWGQTALQIVGLLATLLAVVVITRVAKRELDKATAEVADSPPETVEQGAAG